ncbi:hypothetical protein CDAR_126621 [Caerostris darwini]|uniref:Uncharacterized protein n=1 Tax=Caerostris darwini TaxID=1538125 RepID=A0AAV4QKY4_9ARAC|nr:hypothetical protein CDAR_126621 [Caerostris darwini]
MSMMMVMMAVVIMVVMVMVIMVMMAMVIVVMMVMMAMVMMMVPCFQLSVGISVHIIADHNYRDNHADYCKRIHILFWKMVESEQTIKKGNFWSNISQQWD